MTGPVNVVTVRDDAARDRLPKHIGLTVYRLDTGTYEVHDGNAHAGWTEVTPEATR